MNRALIFNKVILVSSIIAISSIANAQEFKRFSVTAGWMHVMPQGKANPFNINTQVKADQNYAIGSISQNAFFDSIPSEALMTDGVGGTMPAKEFLEQIFAPNSMGAGSSLAGVLGALVDSTNQYSDVNSTATGSASLQGIDHWTAQGTGLEAEDVDTLGLTFNYYLNDNVSLQFIGGIPPKVDIKGRGQIVANMRGVAFPDEFNELGMRDLFLSTGLDLKKDLDITNLGNKKKAWRIQT